jgi:hypothetical protein
MKRCRHHEQAFAHAIPANPIGQAFNQAVFARSIHGCQTEAATEGHDAAQDTKNARCTACVNFVIWCGVGICWPDVCQVLILVMHGGCLEFEIDYS